VHSHARSKRTKAATGLALEGFDKKWLFLPKGKVGTIFHMATKGRISTGSSRPAKALFVGAFWAGTVPGNSCLNIDPLPNSFGGFLGFF
jgi:hypothetical protein